MVKREKYRVHASVDNGYSNNVTVKYVVQVKRFGIWWNISNELDDEVKAERICNELKEHNTPKP
jgi:hypothetical protein